MPTFSLAQGIRMAPDFLPLDVGNLWRYQIVDDQAQVTGNVEFQISRYTIVDGTSYYIFDQFPLAPDLPAGQAVGIRYDNSQRQFVTFDGQNQGDLFPSPGATAEVLETDDGGLPSLARFQFGSIILTLERGVGIVQAGYRSADGPRVANLIGARVAGAVIGDAGPQASDNRVGAGEPGDADQSPSDGAAATAAVTEDNPQLQVEVTPGRELHRFVLTVRNVSDRLLPFDFTTSQDFDFVVVDPSHGQEIWRWSRRRFFSAVTRSEAIRGGGEWRFEGEWNHRDSALEPVEPGRYEVYGVLAAQMPVESDAVSFQVD
jgi:hypothetical protein